MIESDAFRSHQAAWKFQIEFSIFLQIWSESFGILEIASICMGLQ